MNTAAYPSGGRLAQCFICSINLSVIREIVSLLTEAS